MSDDNNAKNKSGIHAIGWLEFAAFIVLAWVGLTAVVVLGGIGLMLGKVVVSLFIKQVDFLIWFVSPW